MRLGRRKFVYFVDDIFNAHRKHAFAVMEGLALGKIVLDDEKRRTQVLDLLKALAGLAFPPPQST